MSVRMQVYLSEELYHKLKEKSRQNSKPMSEYIRESLEQYLAEREKPYPGDPIWEIVGKGCSDSNDLSLNHDRYLYPEKEGNAK